MGQNIPVAVDCLSFSCDEYGLTKAWEIEKKQSMIEHEAT